MRKWLFGGGFLLLSSVAPVFADSATQLAIAKVTVDTVFELSLDRTDIDFGQMSPGEVKNDIPASGIKVISKSNSGKKWYLRVNAIDKLRDGDQAIDNSHFFWYGWSEGKGRWAGTGNDMFSTLPMLAYESSSEEGINLPLGTKNVFKFKLDVPPDQKAGRYETVVRFTLTE